MINSNYWEQEGANKKFTHELTPGWIENVPLDSWVLDLGCGYGRVTKQLYETGYTKIIGYDPSKSMISRAVKENAGPTYTFRKEDTLNQKYSLVVCFGSKDTAIFRHHDPNHFSGLFSAWKQLRQETRAGKTLNGNQINITQFLYKKG